MSKATGTAAIQKVERRKREGEELPKLSLVSLDL